MIRSDYSNGLTTRFSCGVSLLGLSRVALSVPCLGVSPLVVVHDRNSLADSDRIMQMVIVLNTQHILDIKPKVTLRELEAYELHIRMSNICTMLP